MSKFKRKYLICFVLLVLVTMSYAQEFDLKVSTIQGIRYNSIWDTYPGGIEITAAYRSSDTIFDYSFGMSARTVQWGTQVSILSELSYSLFDNLRIGLEVQNGLALFYTSPLYVYSIGMNTDLILLKLNKAVIGARLGLRFTHCPKYLNYGAINCILDIPIGLFISF